MKKRSGKSAQKPLIISGLLLIMIITLAAALKYYPGYEKELFTSEQPSADQNVTDGKQIARINIVDPNKPEGGYSSELLQDPNIKEALSPDPSKYATPTNERVQFRIDRFQKLATQPLKFVVYDGDGRELTPDYLTSVQGEKIHFYLLHANLKEFLHLIPSYADGVWNVSAYMPTPGTYYAYIVFDPIKGDPIIYKYNLVVQNESSKDISKPNPTTDLIYSEGRLTAKMELKRFEDYRAFAYDVTDGDSPAKILPYLESTGLLTIFQHEDSDYINIVTADDVSNEDAGSVSFSMAHLPKGRYTAFAEFKIGNNIYTFPFTFDIGG
jgi:hypothetical protein